MADQIKVAPGELSHRTLNKAISNATSAKKSLDKLTQYNSSTCIGNASYTVNGITKALFSGSVSSEISEAIICLEIVKSQLEALAPLLDSGPEAIENIDRNARLSSKSWAQKVFGSFHGIGSGSVIVGGNIKSIIDQNNCQAGGQTGGKVEVPAKTENSVVVNRSEYNFIEETETIKKEITDRNSTFKGAEGVTFNRKWYPYGPETYVSCVWLAQRKLYARGLISQYYSAEWNAMQTLGKDEPIEDKSFTGAVEYIREKLKENNGAPLYNIYIEGKQEGNTHTTVIDKAWLEDGKLKLLFSDNSKDYAENQHVIPQKEYVGFPSEWSNVTAPVQRLIIFGETQIEQPR